jgi:hypothetical protein
MSESKHKRTANTVLKLPLADLSSTDIGAQVCLGKRRSKFQQGDSSCGHHSSTPSDSLRQ